MKTNAICWQELLTDSAYTQHTHVTNNASTYSQRET